MTTLIASGRAHIIDGIARLLLIGLFALIPFFIIPAPWSSISQGKMLLVAVLGILAAFLWLLARAMEGAVHIPRSALLYAAALLPLTYFVSTLVSGWSMNALVGQGVEQDTLLAVITWFSAFSLVAMLLYGNQAAIRLAVQSFIAGLALLMLFQTLYILLPAWFSLGGLLAGQTTNLLGSWHDLGILAGLALFLAAALPATGFFPGWRRGLLVVLGAAALFLLVVIHFKDIFFASAALFALAAVAIIRAGVQHAGLSYVQALRKAAPFLLATVVIAAGGFVTASVWEKLPARINIVQTEVRPSWQGTFDIAKQSLQAPTALIFGSGPNSFIREWGQYKPAGVNLTPFWNADFSYGVGIIPTSIFAAGLFGVLAWALVLAVILALFVRYATEARPLSASRVLFGISLLATAYLLGYHTIYTPSTAVTGMLFLVMGVLVAAAAGDAPTRMMRIGVGNAFDGARLAALVLLVIVSIGSAGFIGREIISNLFVNDSAYAYQTQNDLGKASAKIETALMISPKNDRAHRAAAELGVLQLAQLMQANSQDEAARTALQTTLQGTIQHGLTAVSIDEGNYQNWLLLAQVYGDLAGVNIDGSIAAAKNAYQKAFESNPTNPVPKLRLAQLAVAEKDLAGARTYLNEAIALKSDFAAAHYLLSQVEASDGKGEAAVAAASAAVQLVPQDPLGWFNLGTILYLGQAYHDAALSLQQAVSLAPDYSNALYFLALSYNGLKMPNDAILALQRVQELNPNEASIPAMIANIKAGKDPFAGLQQAQGQSQAAAPKK